MTSFISGNVYEHAHSSCRRKHCTDAATSRGMGRGNCSRRSELNNIGIYLHSHFPKRLLGRALRQKYLVVAAKALDYLLRKCRANTYTYDRLHGQFLPYDRLAGNEDPHAERHRHPLTRDARPRLAQNGRRLAHGSPPCTVSGWRRSASGA